MVSRIFKVLALLTITIIIAIFILITFEAFTLLKDKANYEENWERLKNTYFSGVVPKIIASLSLIISVYGIVTRRFPLPFSIMLYILAIIFAYITPILNIIFTR